ncbi:hypothetical protein [Ferruginibacter sp.]|nr:hypothetical protein [Ferruginibacter sp.]
MEFLKSINWLFLLQIFLVSLTWLIARQLYKHSSWLNSQKPIKVDIPNSPRLSFFIENHINKKVFFYAFIIIIALPAFLGGILLISLIGIGTSRQFETFIYSNPWWAQVLIFFSLILFYFGARVWWDGKKKKSFLSSKKSNVSKYRTDKIPQKISEIDASRIPTYPRFTIYDLSIEEDKLSQIIFDSSDFSVINKAFGIFDSLNGKSILNQKRIKFKDSEYLIEKIQLDFLNIFDDYSLNLFVGKHTNLYEGNNVPYNLQIIIQARKI